MNIGSAIVIGCMTGIGAFYVSNMSRVREQNLPSTVPVLLRGQGSTEALYDSNRGDRQQDEQVNSRGKSQGSGERAELHSDDGTADLHSLVKSIATVESGKDPKAVGDDGNACGLLQIWPITVKDVNRILGESYYTDADRYDAGKSIEMFMVYSKHYAKHTNDWSAEGVARRWNGGPNGHNKKATVKYWLKVQKAMEAN